MIKKFLKKIVKSCPGIYLPLYFLRDCKCIELDKIKTNATIRERIYCAIARYSCSKRKRKIIRTVFYRYHEHCLKMELDISEFTQCSYYFRYPNIDLLKIFDEKKEYKEKVLIDVGSNVGSVSILASKYFKKVISFEPFAPSFKKLKNNIDINEIVNIEPLNLAISNKNCEVSMYINPFNTGGNSLYDNFKNKFLIDSESISKVKVKAVKLDDYFRDTKIYIGFIKIDVEGLEEEVLMGAVEVIKKNKPDIYLEIGCDPDRFRVICNFLDGYAPFNPNGMCEIKAGDSIPFDVLFKIND